MNGDKNADLREQRPDHNMLCPGDVLYIPENSGNSAPTTLATGATNNFAASAPLVTIALRFTGEGLASQACSIRELDALTGLSTDANGFLSFSAPVTLDTVTVSFDALGIDCACCVGALDPIATLSGVYQRLQNLGYIPVDLPFDPLDQEPLRAGLRGLKWALFGADAFVAPTRMDPVPSVADYDPTDDDSQKATDDSWQPSTSTADSATPAAAGPSTTEDEASAPTTPDPSGPAWSAEGLTGDGLLDDATYAQLLKAHGC